MSLKLSLMLNEAVLYVTGISSSYRRHLKPGHQTPLLKGYQ